jgi:poly-gamma-glutamate synthesis protein (capsule biosynthesis protein)
MSSLDPPITLFMAGDVMTGRGIDQALPRPGDPRLYEPHMKSAAGYVKLAEERNGPIPKPVDFSYIWGDALDALNRSAPDARIINLETAVTTSEAREPKGINYRMHPENLPCLTAAKIDCCVLSNNHVLDWGERGLVETLEALHRSGLKTAGAGRDLGEAQAPAVIPLPGKGRVLVYGFGSPTSGIPRQWGATGERPGICLLEDLSERAVRPIAARVQREKRPGDLVVASIHWGGNWGYEIPDEQIEFAHRLIDQAGADVVHGHSSHHPKGIEVYRGRPVLYGCGDFIDDYEGIAGYEAYRNDLSPAYLTGFDPSTGNLIRLEIVPFQIERFRLHRASAEDTRWLRDLLDREGEKFGTRAEARAGRPLALRWDRAC